MITEMMFYHGEVYFQYHTVFMALSTHRIVFRIVPVDVLFLYSKDKSLDISTTKNGFIGQATFFFFF